MPIPGPKSILYLQSLSVSVGTSGGQSQVWSAVQTLSGSFQPISAKEKSEWNKLTTSLDWKFYVDTTQFSSDANRLKLKESGILLRLDLKTTGSTVSVNSSSGQKVLSVASSSSFKVMEFVIINRGGAREEIRQIASIAAGALTVTANLTYAHTLAQVDAVEHLFNYNIIGVEDWTEAGKYYLVFLQEKK